MAVDDPFERVHEALRARGARIRLSSDGNSFRAPCPAHDDQRPSLVVTQRGDRVLLRCFAGCSFGQILRALELRAAHLFSGPSRERREIVACYDYRDRDGATIAQKVRDAQKRFWWRHEDPSARGGWRLGLEGRVPGLYRLPELAGASTVVVVEGEKAVDRLRSLGLVATCGPWGANGWRREWSLELWGAGCRELVVLPDRDRAGERHAERIAADIHALACEEPIVVKVIELPALLAGGDVVDFLEAGHDLDELLAVVAETPVWFPGAREQRRAKNRAEKAKRRMQKHRAKARAGVSDRRPKPESDEETLRAVLAALDAAGGPCSWRRITETVMAHGHPRRAIDRALDVGVSTGVLVAEGGDRKGRAKLYRRAADVHSVTVAQSADVHSATKLAHPESAPRDRAADLPVSAVFAEQVGVRQCAVTPFAVTPCERSSRTLQGSRDLPEATHVTGGGALGSGALGKAATSADQQRAIGDGRVLRD